MNILSLPKLPLLGLLNPCEMLWNLLVGELSRFYTLRAKICIECEELGELGSLSGSSRKNFVGGEIRIERDHVMAFEVHGETNDVGFLMMDLEVERSPDSFRGADVTPVDVALDFVFKFEGTAITTFVNVLERVLDGLDMCGALHVDVAVERGREEWVVRHDPTIINLGILSNRFRIM